MKILLLGKNGQLGQELQNFLQPLGTLIALDRHGDDNLCGDLANHQGLTATIHQLRPDVIVNAAAYTAVDSAETERHTASAINAEGPAVLAAAAAATDSLLVHYSTDYVFDGSGTQPWRETDPTQPLNHYGSSKLAGEHAIINSGCKHLILRISWVYSRYGSNFINTLLRLAAERETLQVVDDQIGAPTSTELIASVSATIIPQVRSTPDNGGLYHLAASGATSWFDFANLIISEARRRTSTLKVTAVEPVSSSHFPSAAQRPANSRLDCTKLCQQFGVSLPCWQLGVSKAVKERTGAPI